MTEDKPKTYRLFSIAKDLNVSTVTIADFLRSKGFTINENNLNEKISSDAYELVIKQFDTDRKQKEKATKIKVQHKELIKPIKAEKALLELEPLEEVLITADDLKKLTQNKPIATPAGELRLKPLEPLETPPAVQPLSVPVDEPTIEPNPTPSGPNIEIPGVKVVGRIDLTPFERKKKPSTKKEAKAAKTESAKPPEKITVLPSLFDVPALAAEVTPIVDKPAITSPVPSPSTASDVPADVAISLPVEEVPLTTPSPTVPDPIPAITEQPITQQQPLSTPLTETPAPEPVKADPLPDNDTPEEQTETKIIRASDNAPRLTGLTIKGKIELPVYRSGKSKNEPEKKQPTKEAVFTTKAVPQTPPTDPNTEVSRKRKRKRKSATNESQTQTGQPPNQTQRSAGQNRPSSGTPNRNLQGRNQGQRPNQNQTAGQQGHGSVIPNDKNVQDKIKRTMAELNKATNRKRQLNRKEKREKHANIREQYEQEKLANENILEVTEYLTANELATLMDVSVNQVIGKCMELGLFVSINQRIDKEVISLIAEEFGFTVNFLSLDETYMAEEEADDEAELVTRPPIVTVMGHVDHGKTSLLDYIRSANVIAGEAGGITQHIGAYEVTLPNGKSITFLDTPGHEAFTAMRARGAQVTDIAIIVIAADDQVMPQTREAINHAQAANVPMVFAINKMDKPGANPERIREQLAQMNILVEDWGGKYQCQEISAKFGKNVDLLLEKVLLEAEILDLKANPNKPARGTVIEAQLDKGRGVVATILVQNGTLRTGDIIVANCHYGKIKAMTDERQRRIKEAPPSTPVQILGLDGVPQAGDKFQIMESERDARELATKRQQLQREQTLRMQKHITLEEISRRSAVGDFKELNIIVKGDVDGSVEALSDSLLKLSTDEVAVRIIMKGVGQISESDVLLATASNAIIVGFQVRPSAGARKLAQQEQIDIRLYSVIYNALEEIRAALEGLLSPTIEEEVLGVAEVREVFKIKGVGTIAGCKVTEGTVARAPSVRLIRDGIVQFQGRISTLKRFKDDVKEVSEGFECGIAIDGFNDIHTGDIIESFTTKEVKRALQL